MNKDFQQFQKTCRTAEQFIGGYWLGRWSQTDFADPTDQLFRFAKIPSTSIHPR